MMTTVAKVRSAVITNEALKTFFTGALGAMTFGGYSQFQSNDLMKKNNRIQELERDKKIKESQEEQEKRFAKMLEEAQKKRWF